ncbi:MAG: PIN domain-containing protein [Nocardioides sp.]
MQLLAGPTDPVTVRRIQLGTLDDLTVVPVRDFRATAALARAVRHGGHPVRSLADCLIAAVALRHEAALWHCHEDYVRMAGVSDPGQRDLR